jgi:phage-related protein
MSELLATYDRDDNVTGSIQANSFVPEYGSTVSFENKNVHFYTADNNYKKFSKGLNGAEIKFNLKFSNKTEGEARSFLHLLEETSRSQSGNLDFNSLSTSGVEIAFPVGDVYKNITDTYVEDYNFTFHNGLFDIDLTLSKNGYSSFLDWYGSSYLNTGNFQTGWSPSQSYEKFDIVYFPEYATGSFQSFDKSANRIEKFYYCNADHTSSASNSPTGVDSNTKWTRSFFYDVDDNVSIKTDRKTEIIKLENSFSSFSKTNSNEGLIKDLKITLKSRSDKETRSIIHFLEKHEDYKPFELPLPQLYTRKKFFVCKSFVHKFVYKDCNDIDITIDEIVKFKLDPMLDNYYYVN